MEEILSILRETSYFRFLFYLTHVHSRTARILLNRRKLAECASDFLMRFMLLMGNGPLSQFSRFKARNHIPRKPHQQAFKFCIITAFLQIAISGIKGKAPLSKSH